MFEVVGKVIDVDVDEQKFDVGIQGTREDTRRKDTRRKDNIVDGFNDVASRNDVARRMTVIDFASRNDVGSRTGVGSRNGVGSNGVGSRNGVGSIVDGCKDIFRRISRRITVFDNEIWLGMLTKGVGGTRAGTGSDIAVTETESVVT
jgi:hypothetical protein